MVAAVVFIISSSVQRARIFWSCPTPRGNSNVSAGSMFTKYIYIKVYIYHTTFSPVYNIYAFETIFRQYMLLCTQWPYTFQNKNDKVVNKNHYFKYEEDRDIDLSILAFLRKGIPAICLFQDFNNYISVKMCTSQFSAITNVALYLFILYLFATFLKFFFYIQ